jgi:hypothetical protein
VKKPFPRSFVWLAPLSFAATACFSNAAVVALYDFEGGGSGNLFAGQAGLNSADTELNSTATILTTGGPQGLDGGGANNIFNGAQPGGGSGAPNSNWGNGNNTQANANFAQFTITPEPGQQILFESLSLYHGSFNASGSVRITYSVGGAAEVEALPPLANSAADGQPLTFFSEDFADFTTAETVTWRIYVFGTTDPNIGTRLNDITINGTVTPIPEVSSLLLSVLGLGFLARRRR